MEVAADHPVELEAMRKEDSSWHPCEVSLSSSSYTGVGLIVDFGTQDLKDTILTKEEVLTRLRIRSVPLQGDDCSHIKQGEIVLASQNTQLNSLFFDAEVEKAWRVRHSKRAHCRCTFDIKWLHPKFKRETKNVPSSSIMKLARNSIESHPVVSAFLSSLKTLNYSGASSFMSLLEDMDCESNLHRLVEKQIEEISNLADASKMGYSEEILLGLERVDLKGKMQRKSVIASHVRFPHDQNNLRRSTRSQSKPRTEIDCKDSISAQSTLEEPFENRSHLSPLAARAALASLMYQLPQNPFSTYHAEKEGFTDASENTREKHVNTVSLDLNQAFMDPDVSNGEKLSKMDGLCPEIEGLPIPVISKPSTIVKSPISRRCGSSRHRQTKESPRVQTKQEKPACVLDDPDEKNSNITTVNKSFSCSVTEKKLNLHIKTTRLTRSAVHRGKGNPIDKVELKSSTKDTKLTSPTNSTRLTRSGIHKEKGNSTTEVKGESEGRKSTQDKWSESTEGDTKLTSPTNSTRLTRSGIHKEKGNLTAKVKDESEGRKSTQDKWSESTEGDFVTPVTNATRMNPEKHVNMVSLDVNHTIMDPDVCNGEKVFMIGGHSPEVEAFPVPIISKPSRIVKSRISRRSGSNNPMEESPGMQTKQEKLAFMLDDSNEKSSNIATVNTSFTCSVTERKLNFHVNMIRFTRSAVHRGIENSNDQVQLQSSTKDAMLNSPANTTRMTRSGIHKEKGNLTMEVEQEAVGRKSTHDSTEGVLVTPKTNETRKKKSCSSPVDMEIDLSPLQRRNKKPRLSALTTAKSEGEISGNGGGHQGDKRKSIFSKKKPELRFSPRLRFLPRTRSHKT